MLVAAETSRNRLDAPANLLRKLAPDCSTHSSSGPRRLPRHCGPWPAFTCRTLSGSGSSGGGRGPPLVSEMAAATCASPWSSRRQCPATCECTEKDSLLSLFSGLIHSPPCSRYECKQALLGGRVPAAGGSLASPLTSYICVVSQSLSCFRHLTTSWTAAHQAPLFFTLS